MVISASPRRGGNSETLANEFAAGARAAGHQVEKAVPHDKAIGFCRGCLACQKTRRGCVIEDDAEAVNKLMLTAEVFAWATAADDDETAVDGATQGLRGWISCFERHLWLEWSKAWALTKPESSVIFPPLCRPRGI